ncbi:MAG: biotin transporter BioY [Coriobacteriia bacterium]|nr:biotin transporter BioY [Coriobacteriia bacterium]
MTAAVAGAKARSRSRSVVYVALSVVLMAVGAWVTVPFGPIPFTLQTFAVMFALFALAPVEALAAIACYLALGAIGLPLFAGFKGGLAALVGPTGGFLVGFLVAAGVALACGQIARKVAFFNAGESKSFLGTKIAAGDLARSILMGVVFLVVLYLFGWAWLAISAGMSAEAAFAAAVAPFVPIDACKMILAVIVAQAVRSAIR